MESELPNSWLVSSLGKICSQPQYGYTTKASEFGNLRLLRTTDITSGKIDWDTVPYCSVNPEDESKYLLQDGDIVISRAGSVGFSFLVRNPERAVFASYLIRFKPVICLEYFKYFLKSPFYWNAISENQLGIAVPNVNANKLKEISIPLPPANEQRRIVAKIEQLFSELDKGVENLKTAQAQLKVYRQALLKHAFEGKLTAQWREENRDKLESADQLLEQIKAERETQKSSNRKHINSFNEDEISFLPMLPDNWKWSALGNIVLESVLGKMLDKEKNKGELKPYLRNVNVRWGSVDLRETLNMRFENHELDRYGLLDGDLVICEGGEPGRCAVWRKQNEGMLIQKALHRIRLPIHMVLPEYIYYFFLFSAKSGHLNRYFTGTTIKHLTGEGLSKVLIPLCSPTEQTVIINELSAKFSELDHLESELESIQQQLSILRQSILKKAFSGQLVPQDPNDEPASVLLERIKAEKANQPSKQKTQKAKTKKEKEPELALGGVS